MASKRRSRRSELVQDSQADIRRSPRLRDRYSSGRSLGGYPLSSISYAATSRPSLSGYGRQAEWERRGESILNESGQSVPSTFDLDDDASSTVSSAIPDGGYVSEATAQHYSTTGQLTDPQHLYGLDGSEEEEEEEEEDGDALDSQKQYCVVERTTVNVTPGTSPSRSTSRPRNFLIEAVINLLFKLGSLLYLAATAVLCLDVIILHRLFMVFSGVTGTTAHRSSDSPKSWLRFWILPFVLCAVVFLLVGGGLVPVYPEQPHYNISSADLAQLKHDLTTSLRTALSKDINTHIDKHWEEVVQQWVDQQIKSENDSTQQTLEQLRASTVLEISALRKSLEAVIDKRLSELLDQVNSSAITEAMMIQTVTSHIELHLKSAKEEWMKLVLEQLKKQIDGVTKNLDQLGNDFRDQNKQYTAKITSLETLLEQYNSSTIDQLQMLITELESQSSSTEGLKTTANDNTEQLTSLQAEVQALMLALQQAKQSTLKVAEDLEEEKGRAVGKEEVEGVFREKLTEEIGDRKSVLWQWLAEELKKWFDEQQVPSSGLTNMEVNELIRAALLQYSADRIAKFDFALENSGGSVVLDKCSKTYPPALATYKVMGIPLWSTPSSPKTIIQPHVNPGDCWALDGPSGHALIKLKESVFVTGVTLEHISKQLTPSGSISSAPREFRVVGKNDCDNDKEGEELGIFEYAVDGDPIQEFLINKVTATPYSHVRFDFLSNHGNDNYTCVYRVRVHGHLPV